MQDLGASSIAVESFRLRLAPSGFSDELTESSEWTAALTMPPEVPWDA
jgi:hypothetical protein